jgi:hypothetical protein
MNSKSASSPELIFVLWMCMGDTEAIGLLFFLSQERVSKMMQSNSSPSSPSRAAPSRPQVVEAAFLVLRTRRVFLCLFLALRARGLVREVLEVASAIAPQLQHRCSPGRE